MAAGRRSDTLGRWLCLGLGAVALVLPFLDWARAPQLWLAAGLLLPLVLCAALFRPAVVPRSVPGGVSILLFWLLFGVLLLLAVALDAWADRRLAQSLLPLLGPEPDATELGQGWWLVVQDMAQRLATPAVLAWGFAVATFAALAQGRRNRRLLRWAVIATAALQAVILLLLPGLLTGFGGPGALLFLLAAMASFERLLSAIETALDGALLSERLRRLLLLPIGVHGVMLLTFGLSLAGARLVAGQGGLTAIMVGLVVLLAVRIECGGARRILPVLVAVVMVVLIWALLEMALPGRVLAPFEAALPRIETTADLWRMTLTGVLKPGAWAGEALGRIAAESRVPLALSVALLLLLLAVRAETEAGGSAALGLACLGGLASSLALGLQAPSPAELFLLALLLGLSLPGTAAKSKWARSGSSPARRRRA